MGSLFGDSSYLSISQTWIKMVKIQRTCMAPFQCPSFVYVEPTDEEPGKEVLFHQTGVHKRFHHGDFNSLICKYMTVAQT